MAATMAPNERYFVYENRLATFQAPQPVGKRRDSHAGSRAPKSLHWPHKSLSPASLASAGFFFDPFPESLDNAVCFLCNKGLDGWEEDDNPLEEHLKHSPNCAWAIMAAIEAELGDYGTVHPLEPAMVEARKATFGGQWPYESKKGFKCKTKQLAEAGWKYTPTLESDDMATCAYCQLALDGWESGDKPIDEHYKRSSDCPFFALISQYPAPKKAGRARAATVSKAVRLSNQSVATVATGISDQASAADVTADHDDSVLTTASTMTQGGKKALKARKAATAKGRKTKAKKDEAVEILEDEPRETRETPQKPTRGRKRASDAMEDSVVTNSEAPAAKKRATRVRKSNAVDNTNTTMAAQDVEMTDAAPAQPLARQKKGRASTAKTTRNASQSSLRSQASTASLRSHNDDDEIDRQLQADLERAFTDDEDLAADSEAERKKAPAPARGRPKKAAATRKASAQTTQKAQQSKAYAMFDPTPVVPDEAQVEAELKTLEAAAESETAAPEAETLAVPKKGRKAGTRKASKQTKKAKEPLPPPALADEQIEDAATAPPTVEDAAPEVGRHLEEDAELLDNPDLSTGTVVTKSAGRPSLEKRGRGLPPKTSTASQPAVEAPEPQILSGIPVQIEVRIESSYTRESLRARESFLPVKVTPAKIARKPVAAPAPVAATPVTAPIPATAPTPVPPTPARTEKALPPPPPQSESRLPRPPTTPRSHATPSASARQAAISPSQSPQSSDAENHPPSSKPAASAMATRVVLAPVAATPMRGSPSRRNIVAGLQSTAPWSAVDLELVFSPTKMSEKENGVDRLLRKGGELTSPEKRMTVEEWIYHNAGQAEQKLKHECEAMVTMFEREGTRAMHTLEGLVVE
ncbi:hypothetical protein B0T26DRAFT_540269 [Lasiosphaeria miniovina]|uniref:Protein bir1 n=1 Tax=Lasiosphaeria miniovina TaxID=1954250 RepID=A0AA39ZRE2_9PEZI|nr:uncharacterized protein B0T26DRAFT_540269 [Lasiosphaeria miniovina]KAK0702075.1 hypothetical protein B0T26DRAFT_540269 [Lasiosphaeria miniovina]